MQNKIKIINEDGTSQSTKVLNSDGGEIKFITSLNVSFSIDDAVKAQIELLMPKVEVFAEAEYIMPKLSEYSNDYLHKLNQAISKYLEGKSITNIKYLSKNEINAMAEALPSIISDIASSRELEYCKVRSLEDISYDEVLNSIRNIIAKCL